MESDQQPQLKVAVLSQNINTFGMDLFTKVLQSQATANENIVYSSYSISTALAMAAIGSSGATLNEFLSVLHLEELIKDRPSKESESETIATVYNQLLTAMNSTSESEFTLRMANAILTVPDFPLFSEYSEKLSNQFKATSKVVEDVPNLVKELNEWSASKTEGKITKIIDQLDPSSKLVILNAIYFKGIFEDKFDASLTKSAPFYTLHDGTHDCDLMYRKAEKILYKESSHFQAVQLPYRGKSTSLMVFLPKETGNEGLETVVKALQSDESYRGFTQREGQLWLPRFTAETRLKLNSFLQDLGLKNAFSETTADFSKMSQIGLVISEVVHKAFIEVNEEGTEAAAATAVTMRAMAIIKSEPFEMRVDRPFLFAIRHNTLKSTLFAGTIHSPRGKK